MTGDPPGGTAGGWSNWSGSNMPGLQGGETAALLGIPPYDTFSPKQGVQSALLFMRSKLQPVGSNTSAWIPTLQCTFQPVDNQQLAYQLGYLIGEAARARCLLRPPRRRHHLAQLGQIDRTGNKLAADHQCRRPLDTDRTRELQIGVDPRLDRRIVHVVRHARPIQAE